MKPSRRKSRRKSRNAAKHLPAIADPFDLTPADVQRAAQQLRGINAQRKSRGQQRAAVIAPNQRPDHSESIRRGPPPRDPGRGNPVDNNTLYFESWRNWISANRAKYRPEHYLGISPVWFWHNC